MTKRQDLCLQRCSRPEQSDQRQANQAANISHQPRASPDSTSLASRIEFPTMTVGDFQQDLCSGAATAHKHVRSKRNEFCCIFSCCSLVASAPAHFDLHVAPWGPTQLLEPFDECCVARLRVRRIC